MRLAMLLAGFAVVAAAEPPPIVGGPYPRAFFFRASEGRARSGRVAYEEWTQEFSRLSGIMGKVLDEEVPGTSEHNIEYFRRFKQDHPYQAVFLHYNGNARDPRVAEEFFPGHWLYWTGATLTEDLPADANAGTVHVSDATLYRLNIGRYDDKNEDLMIARLVDGKVDFFHAEHVELADVDAEAKTLTVKRGCFGTEPLEFKAGEAVVQPHVYEGPWGRRSNLMWHYNWRPDCPRDAEGRTAADLFVAEFTERFGAGGELAYFDGIEFDVLGWRKPRQAGRRGLDSDGDNQPDGGVRDGVNVYGRGIYELCQRLRAALPGKVWMGDGWSMGNQRAVGALNGIESEGWPTLQDGEVVDWSGGLNRHRYWMQFAPEPRFSYVNHKHETKHGMKRTPRRLARLVQAACVMMDSAFTYSMPAPGRGRPVQVYDELVAGADNEVGWLGQPRGEPMLLAAEAPDLLADMDLAGVAGASVSERDGVLTLAPEEGDESLSATLTWLRLPPGDLTIRCRVRSRPPAGMPDGVPRYVALALHSSADLMSPAVYRTGMQVRGQDEGPVDPETGAGVRYYSSFAVDDVPRRAIFAHPPWRGASGRTWWERTVDVPAEASLEFLTGLPKRPGASDGVTFIVAATPEGGEPVELFREHRPVHPWQKAQVDLSPVAGRTVALRFIADAGPADDTTADHAVWAGVRLTSATTETAELLPPVGHRTGMQMRGHASQELDPASGAAVRYQGEVALAGEQHRAMFAHPPYKGGVGRTWWEQRVDVPPNAALQFFTGLSDQAKADTDGVTFIVQATPENGGPMMEVFNEHRAARRWEAAEADLSALAGQKAALRFIVDCGAADNCAADQALWGDVRLVAGAAPVKRRGRLTPDRIMTWAGPEWFEAGFYFREAGPDAVDLAISAEGKQPLEIADLRAYSAPDVWVRVFEGGLAIANPSQRAATVDLTRVSPGVRYRRIQGTEHQSPELNTGGPCGQTEIVPPRDALFLKRVE